VTQGRLIQIRNFICKGEDCGKAGKIGKASIEEKAQVAGNKRREYLRWGGGCKGEEYIWDI